MPNDIEALKARLLRECVRFSVWAAGEGICPIEGQPANGPEDFLYDFATAAGDEDYDTYADRLVALSALSQPHPADERVVEALRIARSFIAREYRDEKSLALEGEFVSKEARPVFSALSEALAALTTEGR